MNIPCTSKTIQLYYMTTVRSDELVCSFASSDGRLYVNVMCYQQAMSCNDSESAQDLSERKYKELIAYWITRISSALRHAKSEISYNKLNAQKGLYSKEIRKRFIQEFESMQ